MLEDCIFCIFGDHMLERLHWKEPRKLQSSVKILGVLYDIMLKCIMYYINIYNVYNVCSGHRTAVLSLYFIQE